MNLNEENPPMAHTHTVNYSILGVPGAVLSYLVPGLGQIIQGRISKGLLFFVCINGLFYYGLALGQWKNVYLPHANNLPPMSLPLNQKVPNCLSYRLQYVGQFWVGISAWPAIYQHFNYDEDSDPPPDPYLGKYQRTPPETELNLLQNRSDRSWDLGWVYTVIAGVLNIMVIYDALMGPVMLIPEKQKPQPPKDLN
jgi:hypothetical protein